MPHTGLSFDSVHTDWEFLLPSLVDDEELGGDSHTLVERANGFVDHGAREHPPLISGFIALVRVFLCVVDLLSNGFPGSPPQAYSMGSGTLRPRVFPEDLAEPLSQAAPKLSRSTLNLSGLLRIIRKLQSALEELPDGLKTHTLDPELRPPRGNEEARLAVSYQFDVMRTNIHITSLYIQSTVLET